MIKVDRPPPTDPAISPIIAASIAARQALLDAFTAGQKPTVNAARYRAYKQALLDAFHGKCAYCDSFIDDTQHGHVEHYRPKNRVRNLDHSKIEVEYPLFGRIEHLGYFWLAYDWSNLLPACDLCNTYTVREGGITWGKGDRFPVKGPRAHLPEDVSGEEPLLLDPTCEDPNLHLHFASDGYMRGLTAEGEETISLLGLNRRERLLRMRGQAYDAAREKLTKYLNADVSNSELLRLREQINDYWFGRAEHAALGRLGIAEVLAVLRRRGLQIPMPLPDFADIQ